LRRARLYQSCSAIGEEEEEEEQEEEEEEEEGGGGGGEEEEENCRDTVLPAALTTDYKFTRALAVD
jgi:hypothetical protein